LDYYALIKEPTATFFVAGGFSKKGCAHRVEEVEPAKKPHLFQYIF
jgi:hypothetical protein